MKRCESSDPAALWRSAAEGSSTVKHPPPTNTSRPGAFLFPLPLLRFTSHMKRPAIFFDRDNTLIACDDYLGDPSKVQLVGGAADAVARARALGYATVVISNQSGVARGFFDETAVHHVNQ